jgi:hypothetical protein
VLGCISLQKNCFTRGIEYIEYHRGVFLCVKWRLYSNSPTPQQEKYITLTKPMCMFLCVKWRLYPNSPTPQQEKYITLTKPMCMFLCVKLPLYLKVPQPQQECYIFTCESCTNIAFTKIFVSSFQDVSRMLGNGIYRLAWNSKVGFSI